MVIKKHLIYIHTIWSRLGIGLFLLFIFNTMIYIMGLIPFWGMVVYSFLGAIGSLLWFMCKKEVYLNDKEYSLYIFRLIRG